MKYTFDLYSQGTRKETTTSYEEAKAWLLGGFSNRHVLCYNNANDLYTYQASSVDNLSEWLEGMQVAAERLSAWKPEKAFSPTMSLAEVAANLQPTEKVNLKNAVGATKAPLHPVPPIAFIALGQAMNDGKIKYELYNWREAEATVSVFYDAMQRHMLAYLSGENHAPDSKVHHLAHIMAGAAILLDAELHGRLIDDRHSINGKTIEEMMKLLKAE